LFKFYTEFGRELSDTKAGNAWYSEYCRRKGIECPQLPDRLSIDGRELFGRMMREAGTFDEVVVQAIRRIKAVGKWRVIALTNNFAKTDIDVRELPLSEQGTQSRVTVESELAFLGWQEGPTPPHLRALFDDFCDSSTLGMRKPEPEFYLLACKRNGIQPNEAVFLDDLGINLKVAQSLGMEVIHVPIGGSRAAIKKLEEKLGIDLTSGLQPSEWTPSKM